MYMSHNSNDYINDIKGNVSDDVTLDVRENDIKENVIILALTVIFILAIMIFVMWWQGIFLPKWIVWDDKEAVLMDHTIELHQGKLSFEGKTIKNYPEEEMESPLVDDLSEDALGNDALSGEYSGFETLEVDASAIDSSWKVQNMLVFDVDHDSYDELILLVWKHGSYGKHMPFWEKYNDIDLEQHIFIYKTMNKDNRILIRPIWMSSSLGKEIVRISEGEDKLIVLEDTSSRITKWEWRGFGLKLRERVE